MAVEFENSNTPSFPSYNRPPKGLIGLVLKSGIVKTENQANLLLVAIIIVSIAWTILFFVFRTGDKQRETPPRPPPDSQFFVP